MARSRRGFASQGRRPMTWIQGPSDAGSTLSATGMTLWSAGISGVSQELNTITRFRGGGQCLLKTAAAAGDGFLIALGLALISDEQFAVGVTAIPDPIVGDWDGWIWHQVGVVQAVTATIADGVNAASASWRYEIDSKAMRKWDASAQTLVGVISVSELGTASMEHNADTRVLLKT